MHKDTYTVEIHQAGQPRPYADTIHDATISHSSTVEYRKDGISEEKAKELFKLLVCGFKEPAPDWAAPTLKSCTPVGEKSKHGLCPAWRIKVTSAFTD